MDRGVHSINLHNVLPPHIVKFQYDSCIGKKKRMTDKRIRHKEAERKMQTKGGHGKKERRRDG